MTLPMKPELQAVWLAAALQRFVAEVHRRRLVELLLGAGGCWCERLVGLCVIAALLLLVNRGKLY